MSTIIGNNSSTGSSVSPNRAHIHNYAPYLTTPTEDLSLSEAFLYVNAGNGTAETTVEVGVYRNSDYALIEKTMVSIPIDAPAGWYSASFSAQSEIISGVEYTVALTAPSGGSVSFISSDNGSLQSPFNDTRLVLSDPFETNGSVSRSYAVYVTAVSAANPTLRKGSQFTVETTLAGTVTSATLDGAAITVDSQSGATVTLTDSDGSITTSGEYDLVLTDDAAATETITVQVNVYGVVPSNNPLQKDGAALASLTNVEVRVSAGATLAGSQLFYSGTATTDASGNLGNIDLSSTNAADADPVLLSIRTAAGDSIVATETVGII